jgi:hypothetical protein
VFRPPTWYETAGKQPLAGFFVPMRARCRGNRFICRRRRSDFSAIASANDFFRYFNIQKLHVCQQGH